jgi:hypothetical protein
MNPSVLLENSPVVEDVGFCFCDGLEFPLTFVVGVDELEYEFAIGSCGVDLIVVFVFTGLSDPLE